MFYTRHHICGPLGRHFCLKCVCTAAESAIAPVARARQPASHTFNSLNEDLQRSTDAGANVDRAKRFNNVIGPAFFDVPLDQVG